MKNFISDLEGLNYFTFIRAYSGLYRPLDVAAMRLKLPDKLRTLVDAFYLRRKVRIDELASIITDPILERFLNCKILAISDESNREVSGKCILSDVRGHPYFFEPSPDSIAYFAEDSLALERYTRKTKCRNALDLCAGPGIQSLSLSDHSDQVTAVEVDETAYKILMVNIEMNKNHEKITALNTSASDFISESTEEFDQVVCNPPLLPLPNDLKYPAAGHGGEDGLCVTRDIVQKAKTFLSPNGVLELIGCSLYGDLGLEVLGFFEEASMQNNLAVSLFSLSCYPWTRGSIFFQNLLSNSLYQNPASEAEAAMCLRAFMEKRHAIGMAFFFAKIKKAVPLDFGLRTIDFSSIYKTGWTF